MFRPGLVLRGALTIPVAKEDIRGVGRDPGIELDNGCFQPLLHVWPNHASTVYQLSTVDDSKRDRIKSHNTL